MYLCDSVIRKVISGLILTEVVLLALCLLQDRRRAVGSVPGGSPAGNGVSVKRSVGTVPSGSVPPVRPAAGIVRGEKPRPLPARATGLKPAVPPQRAGSAAEADDSRVVRVWESLVDEIAELDGPAAYKQRNRVKKAFDRLNAQARRENIGLALNLLSDDQFPALYGILFDSREDGDVLDAIFSDALNRDEGLKRPLVAELAKDKGHPCFFESARILDVVGREAE